VCLVRDSSAVRRLFLLDLLEPWDVRESAYGKQRIFRCNSASTHFHASWLSDFIFYPNPLYKSFRQSFFYSFITILPSESGVTLDYSMIFSLRPCEFVISHPFWNICHVTSRKLRLLQCIMGDDLHINKQTNIFIANHRHLLRQNNKHKI
jgi:hypothetical protein